MRVTHRQQSFHAAAQQERLQFFRSSPLFGKFTLFLFLLAGILFALRLYLVKLTVLTGIP